MGMTHYCITAGYDGWPGGNGVEDGVNGRPGDRLSITAPYVSFDIEDIIAAFGERIPAAPIFSPYSTYENTIVHGGLMWLDRDYSEAEAAWWTLWFRHLEDAPMETYNYPNRIYIHRDRTFNGWGGAGWGNRHPFASWHHMTRGRGVLRSRINTVPCGTDKAFLPRSCRGEDQTEIVWPSPPSPPPSPSFPSPPSAPPASPHPPGAPPNAFCEWWCGRQEQHTARSLLFASTLEDLERRSRSQTTSDADGRSAADKIRDQLQDRCACISPSPSPPPSSPPLSPPSPSPPPAHPIDSTYACLCTDPEKPYFHPNNTPIGWAPCNVVFHVDNICGRPDGDQEHARTHCCEATPPAPSSSILTPALSMSEEVALEAQAMAGDLGGI